VLDLTNKEIAKIISKFADLLAIKGANDFKVRAYSNAARKIESLTDDITELVEKDKLENVNGIGSGIAEAIKEILEFGVIEEMEAVKQELPAGVVEMTNIPGLGPKTAHRFYYELGIDTIESLQQSLEAGEVQELKGFGKKSEEKLLHALENYEQYVDKIILSQAVKNAREIISEIKDKVNPSLFEKLKMCGSARRAKQMTGDLDILIATSSPEKMSDILTELDFVEEVIGAGKTKVSIRTTRGIQTDFRMVSSKEFPSALHYFTGSKGHNVRMRQLAKDHELKLNEYGLIREDGSRLDINSEEDIFNELGLDYIIPELREDQGEIEAAQKGELPDSIRLEDIKGDLHLHSRYSDGAFSIRKMAEAAEERGYKYIAVTDHSQSLTVAGGLSVDKLEKEMAEIDSLNEELDNFHVLKGIEVDILKDGSLDYEDEILEKLDFVIASVHSNFNMKKDEMTERIIKAVKNPNVNLIGHPRGRMLGGREPYQFDLDKVIEAAAANDTALEINSSPQRLDLDSEWARKVKNAGGMISINTDAHHYREYDDIELGVATARRGWLEKSDVINCLDYEDLLEFCCRNTKK